MCSKVSFILVSFTLYIYGCRYWEAFNSESVTGMTEEVQIREIVI